MVPRGVVYQHFCWFESFPETSDQTYLTSSLMRTRGRKRFSRPPIGRPHALRGLAAAFRGEGKVRIYSYDEKAQRLPRVCQNTAFMRIACNVLHKALEKRISKGREGLLSGGEQRKGAFITDIQRKVSIR